MTSAAPTQTQTIEARAPCVLEGRRFRIRGLCQGVGFRPWAYRTAQGLGLTGSVRNTHDGVLIEAFGSRGALDAMRRALEEAPPGGVRLERLEVGALAPRSVPGFRIARSDGGGLRRAALVPDLPVCEDCLAEMHAPADRRRGYALITCCACGPRYTLVRRLPFDREATVMADFPPCAACAAEYADPASRRFHAQTLACPACGPRLRLRGPAGEVASDDPVAVLAAWLAQGGVAALKGVGGFHLACDATDADAVARLRAAKRRDAKPFAVMVRDRAAARRLADLGPLEAALLDAPERPVVLARPAAGGGDGRLAPGVTAGSGLVGLLRPYTPLHHALLEAVGRPLVMTSANRSGEPIARTDAEAQAALAGTPALRLDHDRPIARRCDDSVVRVVAGRATLVRRGRGHAPRPIRLPREVRAPVLACGGAWKNAFALVEGEDAWVSPHVGDLESVEACAAFDEAVDDLETLLGIRPAWIAHDLHPAWYTTRYARRRPEPRIAVAHHHAHAVSVMTEHGMAGPALALVWDGTGLGPDGGAWGGELLRVEPARFARLATFRPLALPGADRAIAEPWRIAAAALDDAFDGAPPTPLLPVLAALPPERLRAVRQLARSRLAPRAHGVGRLFDAAAALVLDRGTSRYEGETALALETAAQGDADAPPYPFDVTPADEGGLRTIDLRPALRALVAERRAAVRPARLAARFHATLAEAGAAVVRAAQAAVGPLPLVVAGGCFQNDLLVRGLRARLGPGLPLHAACGLPPGDGGLALGQAVVADALARGEDS